MRARARLTATTGALVLVAVALLSAAQASSAPVDQSSPALCGPGDVPEGAIQGQPRPDGLPSHCGIDVVGSLPGSGGPTAWAGTCAYTGVGGDHVKVLDVSDPAAPVERGRLDTQYRENLHAVVTEDRALLATRRRDTDPRTGQVLGRDMLVDLWDIRTCTEPERLGTLRFPSESDLHADPPAETGGPVHNLQFNPSGTRLYGTIPPQVADIGDLSDPDSWTVRDLQCPIAEQYFPPYVAAPQLCDELAGRSYRYPALSHEPTFDPSGDRLFLGGLTADPGGNDLHILDAETHEVISRTADSPGHSIDYARIKGKPHLLHSAEISAPRSTCVPEGSRPTTVGFGDRAFLMDISDERAPKRVSTLMLDINKSGNCREPGAGSGVHYHSVDDPEDTTFAMISSTTSGLRVWDVRRPDKPVEVAYFNGGRANVDPYYDARTGTIWLSAGDTFFTLELQPQVRERLGLQDEERRPRGR